MRIALIAWDLKSVHTLYSIFDISQSSSSQLAAQTAHSESRERKKSGRHLSSRWRKRWTMRNVRNSFDWSIERLLFRPPKCILEQNKIIRAWITTTSMWMDARVCVCVCLTLCEWKNILRIVIYQRRRRRHHLRRRRHHHVNSHRKLHIKSVEITITATQNLFVPIKRIQKHSFLFSSQFR